MDCVETATFKDQPAEEVQRLLHMVVVGGGPTGVEFAGELQDFFEDDLKKWIPEIKDKFHVTLVEALPNVSVFLTDPATLIGNSTSFIERAERHSCLMLTSSRM